MYWWQTSFCHPRSNEPSLELRRWSSSHFDRYRRIYSRLARDLVAAFRATLEELEGAAILMHVVDVADPRRDEKIAAVRTILAELHLEQINEVLS